MCSDATLYHFSHCRLESIYLWFPVWRHYHPHLGPTPLPHPARMEVFYTKYNLFFFFFIKKNSTFFKFLIVLPWMGSLAWGTMDVKVVGETKIIFLLSSLIYCLKKNIFSCLKKRKRKKTSIGKVQPSGGRWKVKRKEMQKEHSVFITRVCLFVFFSV